MLKRITLRGALLCIFGNVILGIGIAVATVAALGIDPSNGMAMSVAHFIGWPYPIFSLSFNLALFVFELIFGRKYIHFGTFVNWFLLSYVVSFFLWIFRKIGFMTPEAFWLKLLLMIGGVLLISLGLALYQNGDLGLAPYDAVPLMVCNRFPKIPFFVARVTLDTLCLVAILLVGNPLKLIGIGTAIIAFGLGPIVQVISMVLFGKKKVKE